MQLPVILMLVALAGCIADRRDFEAELESLAKTAQYVYNFPNSDIAKPFVRLLHAHMALMNTSSIREDMNNTPVPIGCTFYGPSPSNPSSYFLYYRFI
jgi:hypothetical protein